MKMIYRIISFALCCAMVLSLCACSVTNSSGGQSGITPPSNTDFWGKPSDSSSQTGSEWDADLTPDINVTIIGGGQKEDNMTQAAANDADITTMVMLSVQADLNSVGFSSAQGVAFDINNPTSNATGLYYYSEDFDLYEEGAHACGFVEIVSNEKMSAGLDLLDDNLDIVVEDTDILSDLADSTYAGTDDEEYDHR